MWHSLEDDTDRWTEAICTAFGLNFGGRSSDGKQFLPGPRKPANSMLV